MDEAVVRKVNVETYLNCVPCFFRQAIEAASFAGAGRRAQKKILDRLAREFPRYSMSSPPPQMGGTIYRLVSRVTGKRDPYLEVKRKSNRLALRMYPRLKSRVVRSPDPLLMAVKLAIAGNVMDYGVKNTLNLEGELKKILAEEQRTLKRENTRLFQYAQFKRWIPKAGTILYLADNAGEVVFDRLLIEEIKVLGGNKKIFYAVKERPIINDALAEDACLCGIGQVAEVVSNGSDIPGTVLSLCSKEFLKIYRKADIVISKGQGNFEALSRPEKPVFFLFMAKCSVVAREMRCRLGDVILLYRPGRKP